jgi:sulfite reductase (ferredoxin)
MSADLSGVSAAGGVEFPARALPTDPRAARLVGLYPQVQEGRWMQRVRVLGGVLTGAQWRALGRLARTFTPAAPLHLTTRQDVEFHDLLPEHVPDLQRGLAAAGLSTVGACGDAVRNITVCPCSGAAADAPDLMPLARRLQIALDAEPGTRVLPRKFKVSLSACAEGCGAPFINDLGYVARRTASGWRFQVAAAGSLGTRPKTGLVLFDALSPEDAAACALAAVRVFAVHGDREHRHQARLRHVRDRLGDDALKTLILTAFDAARAERHWPPVELPEPTNPPNARVTLTFPNGDVAPDAADALAQLADRPGLVVRIGHYHQVHVFGLEVSTAVVSYPALRAAARPQSAIVACPGARWCQRALADTNALADRLRTQLGDQLPPQTLVAISGCPNGCAHSAVAHIGLVGCVATREGARGEAWSLFLGGGLGRSDRLAVPAGSRLSADAILAAIAGKPGVRSQEPE